MRRLVAVAALAATVTPLATASALPPPENRAVACTRRYVVEQTNVRDYLWCLSLREAAADRPTVPDHVGECFRQYVTRVEPVPRTPEEYVAAGVGEVDHAVRFAFCVA